MKPDAFRSLSLLPYLPSMNLHNSINVRIQCVFLHSSVICGQSRMLRAVRLRIWEIASR